MSNFSYDLRLEKLETHNIFIRMYIDDLQFQNNQLKIEINVLKGFIQDHCYYLHGEGSVIGPDIYTTHIKLPKNDFDICKNRFTGEFLGDDSMNSYLKKESSNTFTVDDYPAYLGESEASYSSSDMPTRKSTHILTPRKNSEGKADLDIPQKEPAKKLTKPLNSSSSTPRSKKTTPTKEIEIKSSTKKPNASSGGGKTERTTGIDLTKRDLESIGKGEPKRLGKKVLDSSRKDSPNIQKERRTCPSERDIVVNVSKRELEILGTPRTPRQPTSQALKKDYMIKDKSKTEQKVNKNNEKENASGVKISSRDVESVGRTRRKSVPSTSEKFKSTKTQEDEEKTNGKKENNRSNGDKMSSVSSLSERRKLSLSSAISETIHNRNYATFSGISPRDIESLGKRQTGRLGVRKLKDTRKSNSILLKNAKSDKVASAELEKIRRPMNIYARKTNVLVRVNVRPATNGSPRDIESVGKVSSRKLSQTNIHKTIESRLPSSAETRRKLGELKLKKSVDDKMRREIESIGKRPCIKMIGNNKKYKSTGINSGRTVSSPKPNIVKCVKRDPRQQVKSDDSQSET